MRRRLFTIASLLSLFLWVAWLFLNLSLLHASDSDPDHSWYYLGVIPIPHRLLWLVRYCVPIWAVLGVLPAYNLAVIAKRRWMPRRIPFGVCVNCRYNLTGNTSGICPECGTACTTAGSRRVNQIPALPQAEK